MPAFLLVLAWIGAMAAGVALALFASTRTVRHTKSLVSATRIPPFVIGITLLAVGTDLPEIANSVISSFTGHGDLNAGDSIGSTMTQATLILGLLPFFVGSFRFSRMRVFALCLTTMIALAAGALLMRDGDLSRIDGGVLVFAWIGGSALLWRQLSHAEPARPRPTDPHRLRHAAAVLAYLSLVGVGSAIAVTAFAELSSLLGVPEYLLSFFLASIGTSLPELVVDVTALREGMRGLAIGNTLGSSFVDATLSIGIGPLLFPTPVTAELAVSGSIAAIVALGLVAAILGLSRHHTRWSGATLIALYVGVYFVLLA
ncbi:MAG: hypothetical protein MJB57_14690 [Gemmatimonadetes bacterium]|nr:hypothetical protein [Gemmatimonadota bacterium]